MSDLVIGTRRASHTRRNVRAIAIAALAVVVLLLVAYMIFRRVVAYVVPEGSVPDHALTVTGDHDNTTSLTFGPSSLSYSGPIAVLRLVGKPHTFGAGHGRLLAGAVGDVAATLDPAIANTVSDDGLFAGPTHGPRLRWRHRMLDDGIPGHQLLEIIGVVRGAARSADNAPDYESFTRQQAVLDVGAPPSSTEGHRFRAMARSLSAVATLRGTGGDRLLVGRSFALPGAVDGGEAAARNLTVTFARDPDSDMIPFASVGWPGLVGAVSGINAEGICVMVHPARSRDAKTTREAQPVALLAREVLENARSLDDAIKVLEAASPLGAASFLIVDGDARTWAVVERSPDTFSVDRGTRTVVTDLFESDAFAADPENDRARRTRPSAMRGARVAQLLRRRISEPGDLVAILRDNRSPADTTLPAGHRGAVQDLAAVHSAIFDASGMILWIGEGPGASGRFRAFDLRYELRGEGTMPAPPADLPADDSSEPASAHAVAAARRALRDARRARNRGDRRQARELVERALAHAPRLPEALRVAGDYARDRGDADRAAALYERYLAAGADDLAAAEEAEAYLKNH